MLPMGKYLTEWGERVREIAEKPYHELTVIYSLVVKPAGVAHLCQRHVVIVVVVQCVLHGVVAQPKIRS